MNVDIGEVLKNLFSKGKGGSVKSGNGSGGKGKPSDPFIKVAIVGGIAFLLIILYLFLVYFPTQEENRAKEQKIAQINNLNSCLVELSEDIAKANETLSLAQINYKKITNLFHNGKELDDLYRHISMLALSNQLMVVKIQKSGESPVFEIAQPSDDGMSNPMPMFDMSADVNSAGDISSSLSACDSIQNSDQMFSGDGMAGDPGYSDSMLPMVEEFEEEGSKPKKVAYYELKVEFEISGDYASYTNFRKGLAKLKKIININEEKIIVLESKTKKGEVRVETILAIYRLPANESERYAQDTQGEFQ